MSPVPPFSSGNLKKENARLKTSRPRYNKIDHPMDSTKLGRLTKAILRSNKDYLIASMNHSKLQGAINHQAPQH